LKNKEKIINILFNEYLDKDITVILEKSITTDFIIEKAKIVMSDRTLMITDGNKKELIICLDEVLNTKIHNAITFQLENQLVTLDC